MFIEAVTAWKAIEEDNRYEVSVDGGVRRRLKDGTYRTLSPSAASSGHRYFFIYSGEKRRTVYVHIAVLTAFAGPRPNGLFALHLDDDPSNNRMSNLMWGSRSLNYQHAVANNKLSGRRMTPESVRRARDLHSQGRSINSIAREFGIERRTISAAVSGKSWGAVS